MLRQTRELPDRPITLEAAAYRLLIRHIPCSKKTTTEHYAFIDYHNKLQLITSKQSNN